MKDWQEFDRDHRVRLTHEQMAAEYVAGARIALVELRAGYGIDRDELAKQSGVSVDRLAVLESGLAEMTLREHWRIRAALTYLTGAYPGGRGQ